MGESDTLRESWREVRLVYEPAVRELCTEPYPGHPRGCPNWGKRATCPPRSPLLPEFFDLSEPTFVIWNAFDLATHARRMRDRHPTWSDRQVYCCLYWQPKARKQLREHVRAFAKQHRGMSVSPVPEAMGVNVTATMKVAGIELEWPPRKIACQVAIAGKRKGRATGNAM